MSISRVLHGVVRGFLWLLIVGLASYYLIQLFVFHSPTSLIGRLITPAPLQGPSHKKASASPGSEARFNSFLKGGEDAFHNGNYTDALSLYSQAERSSLPLNDSEYASLKEARLEIAKAYDAMPDNTAAERVYLSLAKEGIREAKSRCLARECGDALPFAQDGEEFSKHLTEDKRDTLAQSIDFEDSSLRALRRFPEAVQAEQRLIDYLESEDKVGGSDPDLSQAYMRLAGVYASAEDWHGYEQALTRLMDFCDRENLAPSGSMNWAQYQLVIAYYEEGDTDTALSKADAFYTAELDWPRDRWQTIGVAYQPKQFASLALQIATDAGKSDEVDKWRNRGGALMGKVSEVALHPYGSR
jgi:hypothetical protein